MGIIWCPGPKPTSELVISAAASLVVMVGRLCYVERSWIIAIMYSSTASERRHYNYHNVHLAAIRVTKTQIMALITTSAVAVTKTSIVPATYFTPDYCAVRSDVRPYLSGTVITIRYDSMI